MEWEGCEMEASNARGVPLAHTLKHLLSFACEG